MKLPLIAMCASLVAITGAHAADNPLQVQTQSGAVEGRAEGNVRAFLGIPYAEPPVGDLRWRPPVPVRPWTGVRQATAFGPRPMQPTIFKDMVFRDPGCSEDCLNLNVWTPASKADAKLPVMVWIFGGGLQAGGTSEQRQDGVHLAGTRHVVVVSMNYRLGLFGFLTHPDLIAESPQHAAGNYGLLDQLAALRWVHENIAQFGGDPANVTIFGESAGSMSVSGLMASPLAKGLFHKAIGESGSVFTSRPRQRSSLGEQAAKDAAFVAERTGKHTIAELRAMPAQALLDAMDANGDDHHSFSYTIDGYYLPENPAAIFAAHRQNDVPLLAGWNHDEGGVTLDAKAGSAIDQMKATAKREFTAHPDEFLRLYASDTEEKAARSGADFAGDHFIAFSTWQWLEAQAEHGTQPVFRYHFDRAPPTNFFGKHTGAYHSADILYVFGSFDAQPQVAWTPSDHAVSEQIQAYWTNFARTGNPNGLGLPQWPSYSAKTKWPVMELDDKSEAHPDTLRERYLFLEREWTGEKAKAEKLKS
jgi:para-nitrobenzyl esterase